MFVKRSRSRGKNLSEREKRALLDAAEEFRSTFHEPYSKRNVDAKRKMWDNIERAVNNVSLFKRDREQIKRKISDWAYNVKRKKELTPLDRDMVNFMKKDILDFRSSAAVDDEATVNNFNDFTSKFHGGNGDGFAWSGSALNACTQEATASKSPAEEEEDNMIVQLVELNKDILFGEFPDEMKCRQWNDLTDVLNGIYTKHYTGKAVKDKWKSLCAGVNRRLAERKRLELSYGMHYTAAPELSAIEQQIKKIISELAVRGVDDYLENGLDNGSSTSSTVSHTDEKPRYYNNNNYAYSNKRRVETSLDSATKCAKYKRRSHEWTKMVELEQEKLEVMKTQLHLDRQRLVLEEKMATKLDQIHDVLLTTTQYVPRGEISTTSNQSDISDQGTQQNNLLMFDFDAEPLTYTTL